MIERIKALLAEVENLQAQNAEELEALRIKYLSKKGEINALMGDFRNVAAESKREVGKYLNELKESAQNKINELKTCFDAANDSADLIGPSRTAYPIALGTRHPLSIVRGVVRILNLAEYGLGVVDVCLHLPQKVSPDSAAAFRFLDGKVVEQIVVSLFRLFPRKERVGEKVVILAVVADRER